MNYLVAFMLCIAFSGMSALTAVGNLYWLIVCDINVAIWLFVAWALGSKS